jgi:hypothetical protein
MSFMTPLRKSDFTILFISEEVSIFVSSTSITLETLSTKKPSVWPKSITITLVDSSIVFFF